MGLFDNVEKGIEKAVRGVFSRGSKALQPVEMASALRRELDDKAMTLDAGRTLAPNVFNIQLGDSDFERARAWGVSLAEELCDVVINHARSQGYILQGPVRVAFNHHSELRQGAYEVESATTKDGASPAPPAPAQQPGISPQPPRQAANVAQPAMAAPSPVYKRQPSTPAQAAADGMPVLEIEGQRYSLNASSIILGRSSEADILIDDTGVSRKHLEIHTRDGVSTAVDLGSTNGSYVDGHRVQGSTPLSDGSRITMGRTEIIFRILPARKGARP